MSEFREPLAEVTANLPQGITNRSISLCTIASWPPSVIALWSDPAAFYHDPFVDAGLAYGMRRAAFATAVHAAIFLIPASTLWILYRRRRS